jgi:DNA polymerase-3 subunit gamma/tau
MAQTEAPAYEVTASRRRPKSFDELAGQEFVVSTLKNSLQSGHIAHAYLFSGPRGCGKTSAARILARSLNCVENNGEKSAQAGYSGNPCGVCDNCRAISQGASMDVLEIDGASNNSVNDVRQIKDEVLFPPQSSRYKVYIIDEVHMLSGGAFNALLKTIEEPPPYIVFIFATTEMHKVPATIKSRCQQFNFRLIPIETIQGILKKICDESGIKAEDDALFWIARESTGSMRDAFTLFDQVVSFSAGSIRSDLIREKLGIAGLEKLNALAETCAANDAPGAFALTDEILSSGVAIEQFVIDLAGYYRSLLLLKNGITRESLLGYRPALFSAKALEAFDSIRLEQALELLLECYRNIRYSVSPRFELETAVSKLSWLSRWISPVEMKDAIENARLQLPVERQNNRGQFPAAAPSALQAAPSAALQAAQKERAIPQQAAPYAYNAAPVQQSSGGGRSLSEDFKRIVAAKEAGMPVPSAETDHTTFSVNEGSPEEEDVPLWENAVHKKNEETEIPPQVECVLSVFPGTIVE